MAGFRNSFDVIETENGDTFILADKAHSFHICNVEGSCAKCYEYAHLMAAAPALRHALESVIEFAHAALSGTVHEDNLTFFEGMARKAIKESLVP